MNYTASLETIAAEAVRATQVGYQLYQAGSITMEVLIRFLVGQVAAHNAAAQALAIQSVSMTLGALLSRNVPATGITKGDDSQRLTIAAHTLIERAKDDRDGGTARVERFARAEAYDSAQWAFGHALEASAKALKADWEDEDRAGGDFPQTRQRVKIGWRRGLAPGACELCQWLEKDGYIYPPSRKMHHHTGCRCQQIIVVSDRSREAHNADRRRRLREQAQERAWERATTETVGADAA